MRPHTCVLIVFSCASQDVGYTGNVYKLLLAPRCWWHGMILHELGQSINVRLTPKYFFRLIKSLHLFETQFAFLPLFNPNLDFLQSLKVTKSGHHLLHDRTSKGYESFPGLTSQTSLHARLQRLTTMQIGL